MVAAEGGRIGGEEQSPAVAAGLAHRLDRNVGSFETAADGRPPSLMESALLGRLLRLGLSSGLRIGLKVKITSAFRSREGAVGRNSPNKISLLGGLELAMRREGKPVI